MVSSEVSSCIAPDRIHLGGRNQFLRDQVEETLKTDRLPEEIVISTAMVYKSKVVSQIN